jgi:Skp family chaperone for outer membrane proteins
LFQQGGGEVTAAAQVLNAPPCCTRRYEKELRRLRGELQRRNRELVDKRHLLAVEEQKKRAEADKLAALTALEARSREFLKASSMLDTPSLRLGCPRMHSLLQHTRRGPQ